MTTFTVHGKPVGYYAQGKVPNWKRMKAYHAYKTFVQIHAKMAGLTLPLSASKERPLRIHTTAYFENGVHCDPGNVQKGICDALFYGGSGDKFTGGGFEPPLYDKLNPRVEVQID